MHELKDESDQYFYLPFADRFKRLITSPLLRKLFHYDEYRVAKEGYITDVYDSHVWKTFESKMGINEKLIGLEVSWDGARPYAKESSSIWPIFYSYLNLPPVIRGKFITEYIFWQWMTVITLSGMLWLQNLKIYESWNYQ